MGFWSLLCFKALYLTLVIPPVICGQVVIPGAATHQPSCPLLDDCTSNGVCYDASRNLNPYADPQCQPHWFKFNDYCFRFIWRLVDQKTASDTCIEHGANLFDGSIINNDRQKKSYYDFFQDVMTAMHLKNDPDTNIERRPDLWTNNCANSKCAVITAKSNHTTEEYFPVSSLAAPLCLSKPTEADSPTKQCACKNFKRGVKCDENQKGSELTDEDLCERSISCPTGHTLRIDFAAFGQLKDENLCKSTNISDPEKSTTTCYAFNTLYLLKYWCQGKSECKINKVDFAKEDTLKRDNYCFTTTQLKQYAFRIRKSCVKKDVQLCGNGDLHRNSTCVKPVYGNFTWWGALETCRSMGGNLIFLPNDPNATNDLLNQLQLFELLHPSKAKIWIGAVAKNVHESKPELETCAFLEVNMESHNLTAKSQYRNFECAIITKHYWLCKLQLEGNNGCPHNATKISLDNTTTTCYLLGQYKLIWGEARAKCESLNGSLATFYDNLHTKNNKFYDFISENLIALSQDFWIAGNASEFRPIKGVFNPCSRVKQDKSSTLTHPVIGDQRSCNFSDTRNALCAYSPTETPSEFDIPTTIGTTPTFSTLTSKVTNIPAAKACDEFNFPDPRGSITWPKTEGGVTETKCPNNAAGTAKWYCNPTTGKFHPPQGPDLSNCSTLGTDSLDAIQKGEPPVKVAAELNDKLDNSLYGGDLDYIFVVAGKLHQTQEAKYVNVSKKERHEMAINFTNILLEVFDNLMQKHQSYAWLDIPEQNRVTISSKMINLVDSIGFSMAESVENGSFSVTKENLDMLVSNIPQHSIKKHEFLFPPSEKEEQGTTSIYIPASVFEKSNDNVKSVFAKYHNMSIILPSSSYMQNVLSNSSLQHNSEVVSASVSTELVFSEDNFVKVIFKHYTSSPNLSGQACVFWNMSSPVGFWDNKGCIVNTHNDTHTVCLCNHLTNFAVLMDINGVLSKDSKDYLALTWITIVGCSISIICLAVSAVIFIVFRSLWNLRNTIHCNLCICLLISQIALLAGLDRTESRVGCGITAGILHYFWLASFVWMAAEGVMIYTLLIKVFDTGEQKAWHYYTACYGIPAVIVLSSVSCRWEGYGTDKYCWISTEDGLIYAFAAPLFVLVLFNIVILVMALKVAASVRLQRHQSKLESTRLWIKRAGSLVPLLGLTWVFGFFYITEDTIVFAYFFAIFNSIQGIFIFIFHCLRNEKVQQVLARYIAKKRERLDSLTFSGKSSRSNSCTATSTIRSVTSDTSLNSEKQTPTSKANGFFTRGRVTPTRWKYRLDISVNNAPTDNKEYDIKGPLSSIPTRMVSSLVTNLDLRNENHEANGISFRVRSSSDVSC